MRKRFVVMVTWTQLRSFQNYEEKASILKYSAKKRKQPVFHSVSAKVCLESKAAENENIEIFKTVNLR